MEMSKSAWAESNKDISRIGALKELKMYYLDLTKILINSFLFIFSPGLINPEFSASSLKDETFSVL